MNHTFLLEKLQQAQAIKYGSFTLKSGAISPIYIDLRVLVSYPELIKAIGQALWQKINHTHFDFLCGVPYTALPIATCMSIENNKPMVMRRKEAKNYGTKKMVEGNFSANQSCLIVEDVITTGGSVLETAEDLKNSGLLPKTIAVVVDREEGGKQKLEQAGYEVFSLFTLSELTNMGKI